MNLIKEGQFLINVSDQVSEKVISYNDQTYYRFIDWIYSPKPVYFLSPNEVNELCEIRLKHRSRINYCFHESIAMDVFKEADLVKNDCRQLSILDFGCGDGISHSRFLKHFSNDKIFCCDMNKNALRNNPCDKKHLINPCGPLPYESDFFDIIISIFVMHFSIPCQMLSELKRCLKGDGKFVFNIYGRFVAQQHLALKNSGFYLVSSKSASEFEGHLIETWYK